jgi:hypothetical protein
MLAYVNKSQKNSKILVTFERFMTFNNYETHFVPILGKPIF